MKFILVLLIFTNTIYSQNSELISDENLCKQIKSGIEYLKTEKGLKTRNFRFDSKIENGWNYELYFSTEYVAYELGIEKEKVFKYNKTKTYPIYKKLKEIKHKTSELNLNCIRKKRKPNVELSKIDEKSLLMNITTKRVGKEGSSGIAFLFFFKNGKVEKVYKSSWID